MNPREGNNDPSKSELVESIKRTVSSFINPKWLGGRFDKELKVVARCTLVCNIIDLKFYVDQPKLCESCTNFSQTPEDKL